MKLVSWQTVVGPGSSDATLRIISAACLCIVSLACNGASLEKLRAEAEGGSIPAQRELGIALSAAQLTPEKFKEARGWLERAGRGGDVDSMVALGDLFRSRTEGRQSDWKNAVYWYRRAQSAGRTNLNAKIGGAYTDVDGGFRYSSIDKVTTGELFRIEEGVWWLLRGWENADMECAYLLGLHYSEGNKLTKNVDLAREWYRKAADRGHAESQWKLGVLLEEREKRTSNRGTEGAGYVSAFDWYSKAVAQGHAKASKSLNRLKIIQAGNASRSSSLIQEVPVPGKFFGEWSGQWDETWDVRFTITPIKDSTDTVNVVYEWKEREEGPFNRSESVCRFDRNFLRVGKAIDFYLVKESDDAAFAEGEFTKVRTATLRRVKGKEQ